MRAVENFQIVGFPVSSFPKLIRAMAAIKKAAAVTNQRLGLLPEEMARAINLACDEIMENKLFANFIVDLVQGGAGTSTNMNVNEVVANRALELLGRSKGEYNLISPNDHVNLSQSTNDVYPTAIKIALIYSIKELTDAMAELIGALRRKEEEFAGVFKVGRTELRDAVPMTLGQEFGASRARARTLSRRCIMGITANSERCLSMARNSLGLATALTPYIGYDKASEIAKEAFVTGKSVYDLVMERGVLSKRQLDKLLSPESMIKPRRIDRRIRVGSTN